MELRYGTALPAKVVNGKHHHFTDSVVRYRVTKNVLRVFNVTNAYLLKFVCNLRGRPQGKHMFYCPEVLIHEASSGYHTHQTNDHRSATTRKWAALKHYVAKYTGSSICHLYNSKSN